MTALLVVLLVGAVMAPGPTPPPGVPLPGPPVILVPGGPSPTLAEVPTVTPPAEPAEPSGRAVQTSTAAVRPTVAPPSIPPVTHSSEPPQDREVSETRRSAPVLGLAVLVIAAVLGWVVWRRRRQP